ncbi:MAG: isohexenylglutaconyl-CoA hydratase [Anaerolineae bacterium]
MPSFETLDVKFTEPFLYVTLNRPQVKNAINQQMTRELLEVFHRLKGNRAIRAVVLRGAEGTFCTGGDIKEMQAAYADSQYDDQGRTEEFDMLLRAINTASQVVVAAVEGAAIGGGLGLVCVTDMAIAASDTVFALPEVRLGIIPALITPYVIQRIGLTNARRLMLTGARFDGTEAAQYGVVHQVCDPVEVTDMLEIVLADIRECSPEAIATAKHLIFEVIEPTFDASPSYRARLLNTLRHSEEGQEGMLAFIQKRKPDWARL